MTGHPLFVVNRDREDLFRALTRNRVVAENFDVVLDRRRRRARPKSARERRRNSVDRDLDSLGFAIIDRMPPRAGAAPLPPGVLSALKIPADTVAFLKALAPFAGFTLEQLGVLARRARKWRLKKGQVLFREGEQGGEMFFIQRGTIQICKVMSGKVETVLRRMRPGDFFGEMSLLGGLSRTATARAETDAVVLGLDRPSLVHVIELSSRASLSFFTSIVQRVSQRLATTEDVVAEITRGGLETGTRRRRR